MIIKVLLVYLLSLCDPGILYEVIYDCPDNVFAMEDKSISEDTGIPGACVPVTAAVGHIGNVVIIEGWVLLWILAEDGVRVVIIKIKMGISGSSAVRVMILASFLTAHTTLRHQMMRCIIALPNLVLKESTILLLEDKSRVS